MRNKLIYDINSTPSFTDLETVLRIYHETNVVLYDSKRGTIPQIEIIEDVEITTTT